MGRRGKCQGTAPYGKINSDVFKDVSAVGQPEHDGVPIPRSEAVEGHVNSPGRRPLARRVLSNGGLLAATLLLLLALGEVGVRLLEPRSDNQPLYQDLEGSARRWGLRPSRTVLRDGVLVQTNAAGQRGGEYLRQKSPGLFRIVALGDSFTFGAGVDFDGTYPKILQDLLNQGGAAAGAPCEVLNFGVEGYNTSQELAYLQEQGLALDPDLILIEYVFNDVEDNANSREGARGARPTVRGRGFAGAVAAIKERSHFLTFLSPRLGALLRTLGFKRGGSMENYQQQFVEERSGWLKSRQALLDMASLAQASGARIAVAISPAFTSLQRSKYPLLAYHQVVTDFCRAHAIPVLDLYPLFEGEPSGQYWVSPTDSHPNAKANRTIAEAVDRFLREQRLVPRPAL